MAFIGGQYPYFSKLNNYKSITADMSNVRLSELNKINSISK